MKMELVEANQYMCAINPVHKKRIILDVYTSDRELTKREFTEMVLEESLKIEQQLNSCAPHLRWHVKETAQEAE